MLQLPSLEPRYSFWVLALCCNVYFSPCNQCTPISWQPATIRSVGGHCLSCQLLINVHARTSTYPLPFIYVQIRGEGCALLWDVSVHGSSPQVYRVLHGIAPLASHNLPPCVVLAPLHALVQLAPPPFSLICTTPLFFCSMTASRVTVMAPLFVLVVVLYPPRPASAGAQYPRILLYSTSSNGQYPRCYQGG